MHARTNPRPSLYEQLEALPAGLTGEILDGQFQDTKNRKHRLLKALP